MIFQSSKVKYFNSHLRFAFLLNFGASKNDFSAFQSKIYAQKIIFRLSIAEYRAVRV